MGKREISKDERYQIKKVLQTPVTESYLSPDQVRNHSHGRAESVVMTLCFLNLMRKDGLIGPDVVVNAPGDRDLGLVGAKVQDVRGTVDRPACHVLPCNIAINGRSAFRIPPASLTQHEVKRPFEKTNFLPRLANQVDSLAERTGLIRIFTEASLLVVRGSTDGHHIDRELIDAVCRQFVAPSFQVTFAEARDKIEEVVYEGKRIVDGHVVIDPSRFKPTDEQLNADMSRNLLRNHMEFVIDVFHMQLDRRTIEETEQAYHDSKRAALAATGRDNGPAE